MVLITSASRSLARALVNKTHGMNILRSAPSASLTRTLPNVKTTSFVSLCKRVFDPVKSLFAPYNLIVVALCLLILILLYMVIKAIGSIGIDQEELDRAAEQERRRLDNEAQAKRDRLDHEAAIARNETISNLETKYTLAQEESNILNQKIDELKQEIFSLKHSEKALTSSLESQTQRGNYIYNELQRTRSELEEARKKLTEFESRKLEAEQHVTDLEQEKHSLALELNAAKEHLHSLGYTLEEEPQDR